MKITLLALQDRGRGLARRSEVLTRCWQNDNHILSNWVGERPAPHGGQAGEVRGGATVVHDDGEGVPEQEELTRLHGGNTSPVHNENIVSFGGEERCRRPRLTRFNSLVVLKVEDILLE